MPSYGNLVISTSEDLFGREAGQTAVVMVEVVPLKVAFEPPPCMRDAVEAARIVWLILGRLELRLAEWIVVADPWPAVASRNAALAEQVQKAVRDHR